MNKIWDLWKTWLELPQKLERSKSRQGQVIKQYSHHLAQLFREVRLHRGSHPLHSTHAPQNPLSAKALPEAIPEARLPSFAHGTRPPTWPQGQTINGTNREEDRYSTHLLHSCPVLLLLHLFYNFLIRFNINLTHISLIL